MENLSKTTQEIGNVDILSAMELAVAELTGAKYITRDVDDDSLIQFWKKEPRFDQSAGWYVNDDAHEITLLCDLVPEAFPTSIKTGMMVALEK